MRIAFRLSRLIAGLSIVVCQFTSASSLGAGYGTGSEGANADSIPQGSFRQLTPVPRAGTAAASATGDWNSQQAAAMRQYLDPAVEQAAYIPAPAAVVNGSRGVRMREQTMAPPTATASPGRKGPMFRGLELKWPFSFFGRGQSQPNSALATNGAPTARPQLPANSSSRPIQRGGLPMAPHGTANQSRSAGNAAATADRIPQGFRSNLGQPVAGQPTMPSTHIPYRRNAHVTASRDRMPSAAPASDTQQAISEASARMHTETPIDESKRTSPAEELAAQAHAWSATAQTEAEFTRIIETCRRAKASRPNSAIAQYTNELAGWAFNRRGQLKAEAGDINEAMLDFDDAIRADSKCWRATHNRGVLLAQSGQFEKAFDDFNATIENNPDFAKSYSNRAALLVVAGELQAALKDYQRAIELDADLAIAHRGCGRVCHLLGRLDEAIGHYDAAIQLTPDDAYAVASRADLLTDMGRYVDAAADYNRAIEIDPESAHGYIGSAWLLATCPDANVRDAALAVERATIALELSGENDPLSLDTLAAAQAAAGDFDAAAKSVRQAIQHASADERSVYRDRLAMYQHAKPYRIAPMRAVTQASYESAE